MAKAVPIAGDIITSGFYGTESPWIVTEVTDGTIHMFQKNNEKDYDSLSIQSYQESWYILELAPKELKQVGGDHYSKLGVTPIVIIEDNDLDFFEGNALKYLLRYKHKNGVEDLKKAAWYIDYLIKRESAR
jgi:hypothetical protein